MYIICITNHSRSFIWIRTTLEHSNTLQNHNMNRPGLRLTHVRPLAVDPWAVLTISCGSKNESTQRNFRCSSASETPTSAQRCEQIKLSAQAESERTHFHMCNCDSAKTVSKPKRALASVYFTPILRLTLGFYTHHDKISRSLFVGARLSRYLLSSLTIYLRP